MKRISFNMSFHTNVLPWVWAVGVVWGFLSKPIRTAEWLTSFPGWVGWALVCLAAMALGGVTRFYVALVDRHFDRKEQVYDAGDSLVVIHGGVRTEIPIAKVKHATCSSWPNPVVVVRLVESFDLGREFRFMPNSRIGMLPKFCSTLKERASQARQLDETGQSEESTEDGLQEI